MLHKKQTKMDSRQTNIDAVIAAGKTQGNNFGYLKTIDLSGTNIEIGDFILHADGYNIHPCYFTNMERLEYFVARSIVYDLKNKAWKYKDSGTIITAQPNREVLEWTPDGY